MTSETPSLLRSANSKNKCKYRRATSSPAWGNHPLNSHSILLKRIIALVTKEPFTPNSAVCLYCIALNYMYRLLTRVEFVCSHVLNRTMIELCSIIDEYLDLVKLVLLDQPVGELVRLDWRREVAGLVLPEVDSLTNNKVVPINLCILNYTKN